MKKLLFIFFVFLTSFSFAQKKEFKFGKGISEHLTKNVYAIDSTAGAVIIANTGKLYFNVNVGRGQFEYRLKIHKRIKILKPSGFDLGDFSIVEYKKGDSYFKVSGLKAFSYNLVDGKEVKTKLDKKGKFKEKIRENVTRLKFTLPKVKEGTVIDVTYEILSSDVTDIPNWTFQGKYPVLYSELVVSVPEFFKFMNISQGIHPLKQIKEYGNIHIGEDSYNTNKTTWIAENVPALKREAFITTMSDYYTQIRFQLASTRFQGVYREQMGSWDKIAYRYLRGEYFGKKMKKKGFYKDDLERILTTETEPLGKATAIYAFVRNRMEWDGSHRMTTSESLKKKYTEQKGTSAEINLMLLSMLKAADIQAEPIILSTRDNGKVHPFYPLIDNYNFVVAQVIIDGKEYLLDATDPFVPFGVLPKRCLNYFGRKIANDKGISYSVKPIWKQEDRFVAQVTIDEEGGLSGDLYIKHYGYSGAAERNRVKQKTEEKYLSEYEEDMVDLEIEEQELKNVKKLRKPLVHQVKFSKEGEDEGRIYLAPSLFNHEENPFKQDQRLFPVDFGALVSSKMNYIYTLPQGFEVESMPTAVKYTLPDNGGYFLYQSQVNSNRVQVVTQLKLNKAMYMPNEYKYLKELFSNMNSKLDEAIVIKKSTL